jgi:ketosteroid isomerase-like protein
MRHAGGMTATTDDAAVARELATRLPDVVAGGDLAAMLPLLSPDVRWGPDEDTPDTCRSRDDVARWFGGRLRDGLRARVVETTVRGPRILLALSATLPEDAEEPQERLLVLTVRGGRVADVRAAYDRDHARHLLEG